jgi:hypothetical protein
MGISRFRNGGSEDVLVVLMQWLMQWLNATNDVKAQLGTYCQLHVAACVCNDRLTVTVVGRGFYCTYRTHHQ